MNPFCPVILKRPFFPVPSMRLLACVLVPLVLSKASIQGQSTGAAGAATPRIEVLAVSEKITIDGVLDEPAWQQAPRIENLIQRQPHPGEPSSEKTEVMLLHDADNLYIAVIAHDSEPEKILGTQMARDGNIWNDDTLQILLDTFQDQRNAYYFATNPTGALVDGLLLPNVQQVNTNWDAIWDLRTRYTGSGWIAEMAIPFKSLSFPKGKPVWGFNISRNIIRKQEEDRWSGARLETRFYQMSEAGEIANLRGLNQGIGLDVRPFLAASRLRTKGGSHDFDVEPGLDLFYNLTSSLKLTATVNTDFGETEVDERQINLTRFSLFFPEKRSFFLEDVAVFDFASTGPVPPGGIPAAGADIYPFFSRRIGLLNGEEVPLDVGAKLTGKAGNSEIGFLGVHTGETDFVEGKNFFVGRFKQNLFEQSYVGAIIADGHPSPDWSGQTFGLDTRLATTHFLGADSRNFVFDAFGLKSNNQGVEGDDLSYGFSMRYPNDKWDGMVVYREIEKNFDPGIGFVQRRNVRMYRMAASYNPRPRDFLDIQQMFHDLYYTRFDRLDTGQQESSELYITPIDWHFRSGDSLHALADYARGYERLFEPFEISPGVVLPVGEYRTHRFGAVFATARKRPLSGSLNISYGDYWSGSAERINASLAYSLPPHVNISLASNQTFARLPEGKFTARIFTSTLNVAVSPRLSFSNLVQYDNRSKNLGWQSRMRWTLRPGNDLFISFNQGWIQEDTGSLRFIAQDTKIATKFQYTFRF